MTSRNKYQNCQFYLGERCQALACGGARSCPWFTYYYLQKGIPSKPSIPPPGDMSQGTTVTLACTGSTSTSQPVSHQQPLIYIWRLNGTSLTDTPQNRHTVNGNQLTITGIAKDDMYQLYTCATTETGGPQSDESDDITLPIICEYMT